MPNPGTGLIGLFQGLFQRKRNAARLKRACRAVLTIINTGKARDSTQGLYANIKAINDRREYHLTRVAAARVPRGKSYYPYFVATSAATGIMIGLLIANAWCRQSQRRELTGNGTIQRGGRPTPVYFPTDSQARKTHHYHCTRKSTIADVRSAEQGALCVTGGVRSGLGSTKNAYITGLTATLVVMMAGAEAGRFACENGYVATEENEVEWAVWGRRHTLIPGGARPKMVTSLHALINVTPEEHNRRANSPVMVYDHSRYGAVAAQTQTYGEFVIAL